jgi:hypothetical protein
VLFKELFMTINSFSRSRWPRGLKRGSAAARLLGLWVQILPAEWMSLSCECLYCQIEVSASSWSLIQRIPTECGVSECDLEASIMRKPWPTMGCCATGKKKVNPFIRSRVYIGINEKVYGDNKPYVQNDGSLSESMNLQTNCKYKPALRDRSSPVGL